ncbi:MAG: thymidylate synthase [Candidatus Harrisonbacteria bacterium CG10_big_fil_rev_8_21_14_0_10_42_17]|uniref:Thymidylate synthase n=1 Tax=Candidatus Harrisonbacteria bacterium CG10_big_fil_rev_8_21_14_0_10_42_17 TaxID=1974584 RepID=A0A2M6WIQ8_9BACT|nr:MAG: thymidylate synthase [Candidatus Harrisonbacteria bacterium CG10_big_fil_rev_8_21_14_0_10_42_17]
MKEYLDLVRHVLENGERKENRTGTDTFACFGMHYKINLADGFPLLTTKKVNLPAVIHELLWYLSGEDHIRNLRTKTKIWDNWTSEEKNWHVGNMYGYQWVKWEQYVKDPKTGEIKLNHINQIQDVIDKLKYNPSDRRMIVSAWNPADLHREKSDPKAPALPSCHAFFMFYVSNDRKLSCHLTQRSADLMLGVPFNIACYATLTQMLAQECNMKLGEFSHYLNDCHIYENHIEGAKGQLTREPKTKPQLIINKKPFWDLKFEDFELKNYNPDPPIKFSVAV